MDNILVTKCKGCGFSNKGCKIGKETIIKDNNQFVEGFCRFKRSESWIERNKESRSTGRIEAIVAEEAALSIIIPCINSSIKKIDLTIDSIVDNSNGVIKDMILLLVDYSAEDIKTVVENIIKRKPSNISWKLETYKKSEGEQVDEWFCVDYAIEFVNKTNWFLTMRPGDIITGKNIELIKSMLSFKTNNALCLYYDLKDSIRLVANKSAFIELRGNLELAWFEKIKTFDNWEKTCIRIN